MSRNFSRLAIPIGPRPLVRPPFPWSKSLLFQQNPALSLVTPHTKPNSEMSKVSKATVRTLSTASSAVLPLRAVMVTDPVVRPVTRPVSETTATVVSELVQRIGRPLSVPPVESNSVALSSSRPWTTMVSPEGATDTESTGGTTSTVAPSTSAPTVAVIRVLPTAIPRTAPFDETLATALSLLAHRTGKPITGSPALSNGTAASCKYSPGRIWPDRGDSDNEAIGAGGATDSPQPRHRTMPTRTVRFMLRLPDHANRRPGVTRHAAAELLEEVRPPAVGNLSRGQAAGVEVSAADGGETQSTGDRGWARPGKRIAVAVHAIGTIAPAVARPIGSHGACLFPSGTDRNEREPTAHSDGEGAAGNVERTGAGPAVAKLTLCVPAPTVRHAVGSDAARV